MEFKKGTFVTLEAQTQMHLGRLEKNLTKGDLVEYDGYTLRMGGSDVSMPELRAGVKRGWLKVVEGVEEPVAVPVKAAAVKPEAVKPISKKETPKVENVYDEERIISNLKTKTASEDTSVRKFPIKVESQDDDERAVSKVGGKSGASISAASSAELAGGGIAESQGAKSVSEIKLKTASKQKVVISDGTQLSAEMTKIENLSRDAVPSKKTAKVAAQSEAEIPLDESVSIEDEPVEDEVWDSVLSDAEEGDPVDFEEETVDFEEEAVDFVEEAQSILNALDGEAVPTQGAVVVGKNDSKVVTLPCGVDWDMGVQWKKRANLAVEQYGQHPEILEDILNVEAAGVVSFIKKWQETRGA